MSSSIGGFFATLGIRTDTNSFDKSKQSLDSVTNAVSRMMGTVRNASAVLGVLAITTGKTATAEINLSKTIGLSTEALDKWRIAARIAGADANGLVSEMNTLEQKMLNLKQGNVDQGLATSLGFLGFDQDYGSFAEMDAEQRVKAIFDAAKKLDDQDFAGKLVGDILGQNARTLYLSEAVKTNGLDALLNKAQNINFVDSNQTQNAAEFFSEFQETTEAIKSLTKSFGSDVAKELTPIFSNINNWISENGDKIKESLTTIAEKIGIITDKIILIADTVIKPIADEVIENAKLVAEGLEEKDYDKVAKGLNAIIEIPTTAIWEKITGEETAGIYGPSKAAADFNKNYEKIDPKNAIKQINTAIKDFQSINGKDLPLPKDLKLKKEAIEYLKTEEGYNKYKNKIQYPKDFKPQTEADILGIQDGIIQPNGQVTQVAPDDWVFAFRNISDFAAGFIPHNYNNTSSEIVINQNITINGAKDMPQAIKQQAYLGAQNGIMEAMQNNINRMQMMYGLQ